MIKGKKAMMDDMFDFLFTVMALLFMFMFIGYLFIGGENKAEAKTLESAAEFNRLDSAINNLRIQSEIGSGIDPNLIEEKIKNSKVLDGRVIIDCQDYLNEADCNKDGVRIYDLDPEKRCSWNENIKTCELSSPITFTKE